MYVTLYGITSEQNTKYMPVTGTEEEVISGSGEFNESGDEEEDKEKYGLLLKDAEKSVWGHYSAAIGNKNVWRWLGR